MLLRRALETHTALVSLLIALSRMVIDFQSCWAAAVMRGVVLKL
jgi:hypothetical protein